MGSVEIEIINKTDRNWKYAVFVNPSQIVLDRQIYSDLFPVAWKVFVIPNGGNSVSRTFKFNNKAYLDEQNSRNVVNASFAVPIEQGQNTEALETDGFFTLAKASGTKSHGKPIGIINSTSRFVNLGITDGDGTPIILLNTGPGEASQFQIDYEFLIVPVTNISCGQIVRGNVVGPKISFKSEDIDANVVTIQHFRDGNKDVLEMVDGVTKSELWGPLDDPVLNSK